MGVFGSVDTDEIHMKQGWLDWEGISLWSNAMGFKDPTGLFQKKSKCTTAIFMNDKPIN